MCLLFAASAVTGADVPTNAPVPIANDDPLPAWSM
jgi:hypothetical protein